MLQGQCHCGAVAFAITTLIQDVYVCHCSLCRKATGGNGIPVVVVNNGDFRWLRGEDQVRIWHKPGHDWRMAFCPTCGSPLPDANDAQRMFVPAGLIDEGGEALRVAHHIWVDSRASWDEIGGQARQHPKQLQP